MATILIVEDEPIIAADIKILCEKAGHIVPEVIDSGEEVIQKVSSIKPDLVLLDIALAGTLSGLQVAEFLQKIQLHFIFITSFMDETTISNVQRLQPAAYIVKPFQENNLLANIDLALFKERIKTDTNKPVAERIFIKQDTGYTAIDLNDVLYAEAYDNYAYLFTRAERYLLTQTLKATEEKLNTFGFVRIHKSFIVQIKHITSIEEGYVIVQHARLPIGKVYKKDLVNSLFVV